MYTLVERSLFKVDMCCEWKHHGCIMSWHVQRTFMSSQSTYYLLLIERWSLQCSHIYFYHCSKDGLVVGSVNKFNNWDTSLRSNDDAQLILDRCADQLCLPRLKHAPILSQWVGLRPFRLEGVKLEHELYQDKLHVIHNYGHGGCGVTLSWGCAGTVVQLVQDHVIKKKPKNKMMKAKM